MPLVAGAKEAAPKCSPTTTAHSSLKDLRKVTTSSKRFIIIISPDCSLSIDEGEKMDGVEIIIDTRLDDFLAGVVVSGGVPVVGASVSITADKFRIQTVTDYLGRFAFYGVEQKVRLTPKTKGYEKNSLYKVKPGRTDIVVGLQSEWVSFGIAQERVLTLTKKTEPIFIRLRPAD